MFFKVHYKSIAVFNKIQKINLGGYFIMEEIFEKIKEIIAEQTGKDESEITMDTNVKEDLDADSLDLFQIINDIEDEFEISIEDPNVIVTVKDAVELVEKSKEA